MSAPNVKPSPRYRRAVRMLQMLKAGTISALSRAARC
jgi:hypothetical protein